MPLLKRTTHKPQAVESIAEAEQGFIQIDFADIDLAIEQKLTAAELRLWLYLGKLDRYGNKLKDLPTPKELAIRLGLSQRTVEKAAFRLDELGLFTFRVKAWQGANSSAARARQTSEAMKQAKKEREGSKPLSDKGGYLTENTANFSESGYLAEDAVNFSEKRLNKPNQPVESLPHKDSKTPKISLDSSDLSQTTTNSVVVAEEEITSEPNSQSHQPTEEEVKAAIQEISQLSPEIKTNSTVTKYVIKFWANFPAALEATKKAVREGNLKNPTGFFMEALKNPSAAPESPAVDMKAFPPIPTKKQKEELEAIGFVDSRMIVDPRYPVVFCCHVQDRDRKWLLWWEALGLELDALMQT